MKIDALDELRESSLNNAAYPENLISSPYSRHRLSGYLRTLDILSGVDNTNQKARSRLFEKIGPKNNVEFFDVFSPLQGTHPSITFLYVFLPVSNSEQGVVIAFQLKI